MIDRIADWLVRRLGHVLVVTAVLGLVLSLFLPEHARPLRFQEDGTLRTLVLDGRESVRDRYSVYEYLRDAAIGDTVYVPAGRQTVDERLAEGIAGLEVEVREYDSLVDSGLTGEALVGGAHDFWGDPIEYVVLPGDADTWWMGFTADGVLVVIPDTRLPVPTG